MNRGTKKALLALMFTLILPATVRAQATEPRTCASIHQVPVVFNTTNSIRQTGIDWHKDLVQPYTENWVFNVEHHITSHKFQLEFMEHISTTAPGCNTATCIGENAGETCQNPACAPTLKVTLSYPNGTYTALKAVRQPGLEAVGAGTVILNGKAPYSIVYFLDEDRTTVTVLVPEHSQYGRMIPAGSKIKVTVAVPPQAGQCQELCGRDMYILGSKQRSCQMSYLNCEPCVKPQ